MMYLQNMEVPQSILRTTYKKCRFDFLPIIPLFHYSIIPYWWLRKWPPKNKWLQEVVEIPRRLIRTSSKWFHASFSTILSSHTISSIMNTVQLRHAIWSVIPLCPMFPGDITDITGSWPRCFPEKDHAQHGDRWKGSITSLLIFAKPEVISDTRWWDSLARSLRSLEYTEIPEMNEICLIFWEEKSDKTFSHWRGICHVGNANDDHGHKHLCQWTCPAIAGWQFEQISPLRKSAQEPWASAGSVRDKKILWSPTPSHSNGKRS